jgi:hypothetical protein
MSGLLKLTAKTAARYLEDLEQRNVAPSPEALKRLTELDEPLPELPMEAERVLETLDRIGSPATMGMAGRRYFGFVIGGYCGQYWLRTGWPVRGISAQAYSWRRPSAQSSKRFPSNGCSTC